MSSFARFGGSALTEHFFKHFRGLGQDGSALGEIKDYTSRGHFCSWSLEESGQTCNPVCVACEV